MRINEVLKENYDRIMDDPDVSGVGMGGTKEEPIITIYLVKDSPKVREKLSALVTGCTVQFEETGPFTAQAGG